MEILLERVMPGISLGCITFVFQDQALKVRFIGVESFLLDLIEK